MPLLYAQLRMYTQNATAAPEVLPQVSGTTRQACVCTLRSTHCLSLTAHVRALLT